MSEQFLVKDEFLENIGSDPIAQLGNQIWKLSIIASAMSCDNDKCTYHRVNGCKLLDEINLKCPGFKHEEKGVNHRQNTP